MITGAAPPYLGVTVRPVACTRWLVGVLGRATVVVRTAVEKGVVGGALHVLLRRLSLHHTSVSREAWA